MEILEYYIIILDGIDKSGKELIRSYVSELSEHKYLVYERGLISMQAYSKLYNRNYKYNVKNQEKIINIMLDVDKKDWTIRCINTNEPEINYEINYEVFEEFYNKLKNDTDYHILRYNTSKETPFEIAKQILKYVDNLNGLEEK